MSGEALESSSDIIPNRSEIAEVYKFFRLENTCGRSLFNYRALRAQLTERVGGYSDGLKLRIMLRILDDIKVCDLDEQPNDYFYLEVRKNASKTNIEESATYKRLVSMRAE